MKLIYFICLSLICIGCDSRKNSSEGFLSPQEITRIMTNNNIFAVNRIDDNIYFYPTQSWIETNLNHQFKSFLIQQNLLKYRKESNDCDNFAGWFRLFAQKVNNDTKHSGIGSICIGEICYIKENHEGHAINILIVSNRPCEILFYEPQKCKFIQLTEHEKQSIMFWRF